MPLKSIKPLHLQKIMNAQAGMSKSHVTRLRQEMSFIFRMAVKNHLILDNPAEDLVLPNYRPLRSQRIFIRIWIIRISQE